jgi:hypothetical protein
LAQLLTFLNFVIALVFYIFTKQGRRRRINLIGELTILLGSLFILLSAIGIIRMPDFLMRLQAASKASAFGVILV